PGECHDLQALRPHHPPSPPPDGAHNLAPADAPARFHMKHTLTVRTALKNGSVFELNCVGALGGENDALLVEAGAADSGAAAKRNWWASAKEVTHVTKGKGLVVSGGMVSEADLVANLSQWEAILDFPKLG
ncbi:hypothetical protein B0H10DRAFT_2033446, partial [Mycena sp. CBHHK59/15]